MQYTNKLNLPDIIVRAVTNDTYKRGDADFTVTELLSPARAKVLFRKHQHEITEDVSDVIYRLTGSIGHGILERAGGASEDIVENRFKATVTVDGANYTLSGQADLIRSNRDEPFDLYDWKFTSIYAFKDGIKPEYVAQLNMLKWLCAENGIKVRNLLSAPVYRDWSKREALRDASYPQTQVEVYQAADWGLEKTLAFITEKIRAHVAARTKLPECNEAERWAAPATWAVTKPGGTRAMPGGIFTNPGDAETFARAKAGVVQHRPGKSTRCESYCNVAPFCSYWKQLQAEMGGEA